jgi:hypothetical protein
LLPAWADRRSRSRRCFVCCSSSTAAASATRPYAVRWPTRSAGGGSARSGWTGPVRHPTTLVKLVGKAGLATIEQLNTTLLAKLAAGKLLRGRKLRIDTTVVEADIDFPPDADLLEQAIRKTGGLVRRIKRRGVATRTRFRDRVGRRMRQLAPAAGWQPGDSRSGGVAGRPGRPSDPQGQTLFRRPSSAPSCCWQKTSAASSSTTGSSRATRQTHPSSFPPSSGWQPSPAGCPPRWPPAGSGPPPTTRHWKRFGIKRVGLQRKWHARQGSADVGADPGLPSDAQLAGWDRGEDQPPQAASGCAEPGCADWAVPAPGSGLGSSPTTCSGCPWWLLGDHPSHGAQQAGRLASLPHPADHQPFFRGK